MVNYEHLSISASLVSVFVSGDAGGDSPGSDGSVSRGPSSAFLALPPLMALKMAVGLGSGISGRGTLKGSGISLTFPIFESS